MKLDRPRVTTAALKALLDEALFSGVVRHFVKTTGEAPAHVERQVIECLRYLYLISRYPEPLAGLFLPVEQAIDEVWHYLILQTREYRELCEERLPGRFFIHHRSLPYEDYHEAQPSREQALEEALCWLPLYREEFGPFDEGALPHWTMVRFLHQHLGLSLDAIAALEAEDQAAPPGAGRVR
ncbi:glycine-rich domain-containing protein [Sorangium sp. So ce388]|uniref:glycine-rich domain-containing protein n=1 Tax=Sorangium sp. So ce388 TaxID=3133309 RepID=UPI003F5C83A3